MCKEFLNYCEMKKIIPILLIMLLGAESLYANEVVATATALNFGKAVILANTSTISVDKNNTPIWMRAMKSISGDNITAGEIVFSVDSLEENSSLIIQPDITNLNQVLLDENNCKITLNNIQISPTAITLSSATSAKIIKVGGAIQLVGRCANLEQTPYTSNISIPYSVMNDNNELLSSSVVNLSLKFATENNVDVIDDNDLNFGTVITNGEAGTMTVSPLGGISQISDGLISTGIVTAGEISIYGPLNLPISDITIDESVVLYSDTNTMIVDNFTLSPGKSFSLSKPYGDLGYEKLKIGGTLNVNQNQPAGNYEGIVTITIFYE